MQRLAILTLVLICACSRNSPNDAAASSAAAVVSAPVVGAGASAAAAPAAVPQTAWYMGSWKGDFAASRRTSTTTTKEGGPAAWEKDNGQRLSGPGNIEIAIDVNGNVSGTIKGALGDLGLRGTIDGEDMRAILVAKTDDPNAVQNGTLVLSHDGDDLKGRLSAASGDALTMRQGEVTLKKASP
jgi:hypothetical protein